MEKVSVTAWITASQAGVLSLLDKRRRIEEKETVQQLVASGVRRDEARVQVARMRPEHWPALEVVVGEAVRRRLAEEDLAGPWAPLSPAELDRLMLSGRWPGASEGITLIQRNYRFPSDLALQLRTASWRVSERPLARLYELGLVGSGLRLTQDQKARRDDLARLLYPPARIIREALAAYGPRSNG
ncbi:hypothetical protein [Streptomyces omiyaensis]|uniref:hypothetical protein n=1 Tax=Streptomyces omiyaensis TaxID=68247 RepID=UPI0036FFE8EE